MKQQQLQEYMRACANINYINAKYFYKKTSEIKDIDRYLSKLLNKYDSHICTPNDLKELKCALINLNNIEEIWPELPLVTEAKELGPITEKIELPFPLTKKQLIIINRLLFHPEDERLFITTGVGQSGKSTFLNIIKQLFDNDYSSSSLGDLSNGFVVAEAVKHRLICSDELGKGDLDTKVLKQLASKQPLFINPKNATPHEIISQSALFWCCNNVPKIDATDSGILRRIVYYRRDKIIENPDSSLNKKKFTYQELLIIARRALAYEDDNWFEHFRKETYENIMKNNSVYLCLNKNTYEDYKMTCTKKGLKPYSEPNWLEIKELFTKWLKYINSMDTSNT